MLYDVYTNRNDKIITLLFYIIRLYDTKKI